MKDNEKREDLESTLELLNNVLPCNPPWGPGQYVSVESLGLLLAAERERCASICDGVWATYVGETRRLEGKHATHAAGKRDGANECAIAIRSDQRHN